MSWIAEPNVCPGLFYGTSAQDGYLIRIRTPGGLLNQQQGWAIATLLEQWDSETIQVTNRANLQIRSVHTVPTVKVLQSLQHLGLAAQNPNLDHLRNIMTSPTAGLDPQELIDTRPLVQALDTYIQSQPELAGLPAKFSIGIDGGGTVGIGTRSPIAWEHRYNEIQLSAVSDGENEIYFRLALAADKQLCETQLLIEPDECVSVVATLAAVYLDYVNQTPSQKKPRMKHLLQDWGLEAYLQRVNHYLPSPLCQGSDRPKLSPTQPYAHLGIHPQTQEGLSYIGISLQLGQLTAPQLRGLMQLSESVGMGHLRLTPWQTVLLPDIPNPQIPDLLQELAALGLSASATRPDAAIVACAGKPGCAASATQTQLHALALAAHLNQRVTLEHPINIHLTGCPKSCAQPSPAEITLLGTTIEQNGTTVEAYQVYVGSHHPPSKPELPPVTAAEMPSRLEQLLHPTSLPNLQSPPRSMIDYIRNGDDIYRKSFAIIRAEANLERLPPDLAHVAVRLIHACGMTDIGGELAASPDAVRVGRDALAAGAPIFCDAQMVANGVTRKRLPANNDVICTLNQPEVPEIAKRIDNTRSAAAIELWGPRMQGAVIAIGNAPTALFRLLELLDEGAPKPALILGFPVGFVGAAESKAELAENSRGVPFITLHGRRGGSAIAAAAVNALAKENEL